MNWYELTNDEWREYYDKYSNAKNTDQRARIVKQLIKSKKP
jgi:hypothetical protein